MAQLIKREVKLYKDKECKFEVNEERNAEVYFGNFWETTQEAIKNAKYGDLIVLESKGDVQEWHIVDKKGTRNMYLENPIIPKRITDNIPNPIEFYKDIWGGLIEISSEFHADIVGKYYKAEKCKYIVLELDDGDGDGKIELESIHF